MIILRGGGNLSVPHTTLTIWYWLSLTLPLLVSLIYSTATYSAVCTVYIINHVTVPLGLTFFRSHAQLNTSGFYTLVNVHSFALLYMISNVNLIQ